MHLVLFGYFSDKRKDILMPRTNIPGSAGFNRTPWANYGKVETMGRYVFKYGKTIYKQFLFFCNGELYFARSKITEMDETISL